MKPKNFYIEFEHTINVLEELIEESSPYFKEPIKEKCPWCKQLLAVYPVVKQKDIEIIDALKKAIMSYMKSNGMIFDIQEFIKEVILELIKNKKLY